MNWLKLIANVSISIRNMDPTDVISSFYKTLIVSRVDCLTCLQFMISSFVIMSSCTLLSFDICLSYYRSVQFHIILINQSNYFRINVFNQYVFMQGKFGENLKICYIAY